MNVDVGYIGISSIEDPDITITGEKKTTIPNLTVFSEDLIPVYTTDTGEKVVLGRELHEKLGIKEKYTDWFPRMCEYGKDEGFEEGKSYFRFFGNRSDGRKGKPKQDHILCLRMAKHIATIQKTNIGFNIREKLFNIEEMMSEQRVQPPLDSYMIEDPIKRAERWIEEKKMQIALEKENKILLPKAEGFDKFISSDGLFCFREAAGLLNIGEKVFIEWLLKKRFVYRKSDKKGTLTAYAEYKVKTTNPNGWFKLKDVESQYKPGKFFKQTFITPQGLEAFRKMLKKEGMIQ
ncbi:MAG: phage antirepressor KilAC domain-containing protein [Allobaculum sp.]|nr:phage antirepressor KilAC domain-containing protein [Allobaculum sp.]